jgi:hypothetical protein
MSLQQAQTSNKDSSAVLLLLFNRSETTHKLMTALKEVEPPKIYIHIDGPRKNIKTDEEEIAKIKKIIKDEITWDCIVETNYSEINYGCGLGPRRGISWFFEHEERGVILEDDCIPSPTFFTFCNELLHKYENQKRVWLISGDNANQIIPNKFFNNQDYCFSSIPFIWGWATWKDRWELYDEDLLKWNQSFLKKIKNITHVLPFEKLIISRIFKNAQNQKDKNFWDFQYYSSMLQHGALAIVPRVNLIKNIGWGETATHTSNLSSRMNSSYGELDSIKSNIEPSKKLKLNSIVTYKLHTDVFEKYINTEIIFFLRLGYIVSRVSYNIKMLFSKLFKNF